MTVLFVMPHPDDEAFAVSGTIKRLTGEGHRVVLIVVTDGSAGKNHDNHDNLALVRRKEVEASVGILGIAQTYFLDFTDSSLSYHDVRKGELVPKIKAVIEREKPEAVITYDHTGVYWHLDHVATSLATTVAVKESTDIVDKLFFFVPPIDFSHDYAYSLAARFPITHSVDITSVSEFKKQSIAAHTSQMHDQTKFFKHLGTSVLSKEDYYLEVDNGRSDSIFSLFIKNPEVQS